MCASKSFSWQNRPFCAIIHTESVGDLSQASGGRARPWAAVRSPLICLVPGPFRSVRAGSWKLEAGTLWRAGSWHLNEGAAGSWELRRRSWKISRAASWETEGAAGSSKLGGWREGAAGATRENGACAVLQIRQLEAARGELAQAEPKVQLEGRSARWNVARWDEERTDCACG